MGSVGSWGRVFGEGRFCIRSERIGCGVVSSYSGLHVSLILESKTRCFWWLSAVICVSLLLSALSSLQSASMYMTSSELSNKGAGIRLHFIVCLGREENALDWTEASGLDTFS